MNTFFIRGRAFNVKKIIKVILMIILVSILYKIFTSGSYQYHIEIDQPKNDKSVYEWFTAEVTAYTSSPEETDDSPYISADGRAVYVGLIACPRKFPFGTVVVIGEDTYKCGDRMAKRFDHRFDIWKQTKEEAYKWGIRTVSVGIKKLSTGSQLASE